MGREIVYCFACQRRITGDEFEKGTAFQFGHQVTCSPCADQALKTLPGPQQELLRSKMLRETKDRRASTSRIPAPPSPPPLGSRERQGTRSIPIVPPPPPAPPATPSSSGLVVGIVLGGVAVLIILLALVMRSGPSERERGTDPTEVKSASPSPIPDRPRETPEESQRFKAAREALQKAAQFARAHPADPDGIAAEWGEALAACESTPFAPEARREQSAAQASLETAIARELSDLEGKARPLVLRQEFAKAIALYESSRSRRSSSPWTAELGRRAKAVEDAAAQALGPLKEEAAAAKRKGDQAGLSAIRGRVAGWGLAGCLSEFDGVLAAVTAEAAAPGAAPTPRTVPPEVEAYRSAWESAVSLASHREYAAALESLGRAPASDEPLRAEKAGDLELLRSLGALVAESTSLLEKWPKTQKLVLEYADSAGTPARGEGLLEKAEPSRLCLRQGSHYVWIEIGEIRSRSLGEIFLGRTNSPSDADRRAAAVLALVEGDGEGARNLLGKSAAIVPEKYWSRAKSLLEGARPPEEVQREKEARELFTSTQEALSDGTKVSQALEAVRKLLRDYGSTGFVARNRASIVARGELGRDYLFCPHSMKGSGSFEMSKSGGYWISNKDTEAPKRAENYLEWAYTALPDLEYRAWVYAGGCCLETFSFFLQGTDLVAPNPKSPKETVPATPGAEESLPVKVSLSLKKTHAMHNGPKTPARWDWIPLVLPKASAPGVKVLRILTHEKGFSVAYVMVSSVKAAPPRDLEAIKEAEKISLDDKGEAPGAVDSRPVRKIFDGQSLACMNENCLSGWKLEGGAVVQIQGVDNAAQSKEDFDDGELRIRFDVQKDGMVWFEFRQGPAGGFRVQWPEPMAALGTTEHELVFTGRGDSVIASLDGKEVAPAAKGSARSGRLAWNCSSGGLRVKSIEIRK